jgi:phosphatidylserine/phosphatidylglycerophosphate/cardiolipin synthase-like enzyme
MKKISSILFILLFYVGVNAQIFGPNHHIIVYSTHTVDTTVARPHNKATALIRCAADTLMHYINRAKYTIDIALYDFVEDSLWYEGGHVSPIHKAINSAYKRGVKIRWIENLNDSSAGFANSITPNYGLDSINPAIPTMQSPSYSGIMHNKFMIIDGLSSNPNDAIVWTGCMNWEPGQLNKDINNIIIFQDSSLAHNYLKEFNQMWGDSVEGGVPNYATSLYGYKKKVVAAHSFRIDGHEVELWFSPQDTVSNHIVSTEKLAKSEIDFEMFTFTYEPDAAPLIAAVSHGIAVRGMMDQASLTYTPYGNLSSAMGANLQVYTGLLAYDTIFPYDHMNGICHSKYMIIDPCDYSWPSESMVLTGSHNWSASANTSNNENTVIVHDSSVANQYYQAFHADFLAVTTANGGAINLAQTCIPLGIGKVENIDMVTMYPNPANNDLKVMVNIPGSNVQYNVYNVTGQIVASGKLDARYVNTINISNIPSGMYLLRVQNNNTEEFTGKFIKQ